jgi:hypothetical protein
VTEESGSLSLTIDTLRVLSLDLQLIGDHLVYGDSAVSNSDSKPCQDIALSPSMILSDNRASDYNPLSPYSTLEFLRLCPSVQSYGLMTSGNVGTLL